MPDKEPAGFTNEHVALALNSGEHAPICRCPGTIAGLRSAIRSISGVSRTGGGGVAAPRNFSRRGAGAQGFRTAPDRTVRRRRFSHGRHGSVDRRALQEIPLLFVLCNNRSFYNDELHQERMARARATRRSKTKWIGHVSDPDVDLHSHGPRRRRTSFRPGHEAGRSSGRTGESHRHAARSAVVPSACRARLSATMTVAMTRAGT